MSASLLPDDDPFVATQQPAAQSAVGDDPFDVATSAAVPAPRLNKIVRGVEKLQGVQPDLLNHWNNLQGQFSQAGLTPEIKSGFRTTAQQQALYNNPATRARTKGNDGLVNISPHQEGRALDISFPSTQKAKGRQIIANYARQNGLTVPSDEPWHIAIPKQGQQDDPFTVATKGQPTSQPEVDDPFMVATQQPAQPKERVSVEARPIEFQSETPQAPISDLQTQPKAPIQFEPDTSEPTTFAARAAQRATGAAKQGKPLPSTHPDLTAKKIVATFDKMPESNEAIDALMAQISPDALSANQRYRAETGRNLALCSQDISSLTSQNPQGKYEVSAAPTQRLIRIVNAYNRGGVTEAQAESKKMDDEVHADLQERAKAAGDQAIGSLKEGYTAGATSDAQFLYNISMLSRALYTSSRYGTDSPEYQALEKEDKGNQAVLNEAQRSVGSPKTTTGEIVAGALELPQITAVGGNLPVSQYVRHLNEGQVEAGTKAMLAIPMQAVFHGVGGATRNLPWWQQEAAARIATAGIGAALAPPGQRVRGAAVGALLPVPMSHGAITGEEGAPLDIASRESQTLGVDRAQTVPDIEGTLATREAAVKPPTELIDEKHYSNYQPRRARNTESGNKGQFKTGPPQIPPVEQPAERSNQPLQTSTEVPRESSATVTPQTLQSQGAQPVSTETTPLAVKEGAQNQVIEATGEQRGQLPIAERAPLARQGEPALTPTTPEGFLANEKGEPLTVYHGTSKNFDKFGETGTRTKYDSGYSGRGFYFSDSKTASTYAGKGHGANVRPVHLRMTRPLEIFERKGGDDQIIAVAKALNIPLPLELNGINAKRLMPSISDDITKALTQQGYDGVIYHWHTGNTEWMVPHVEQISPKFNPAQETAAPSLPSSEATTKNLGVEATGVPSSPESQVASARSAQGKPIRTLSEGAESKAVTERGTEVNTKYAIVEAANLISSHDNLLNRNPAFPEELQPRDRGRAASEVQIQKIEKNPRGELLAESPKASGGEQTGKRQAEIPGMESPPPETTGIAHRVETATRGQEPSRGQAVGAPESVERGRQLLSEGGNLKAAIDGFEKSGAISADAMALVRARHEELAQAANRAFDAGRQKLDSPEFRAAEKTRQDFYDNAVKPMQTAWSNTGRAQQGETNIDTGTFYGMYRAFKDFKGREPSPREAVEMQVLAERNAKVDSDVKNLGSQLAAELDRAAGIKDLPDEVQKSLSRFIDQAKRESRRTGRQQTRKSLDDEAAVIKQNLAAAFQKVRNRSGIQPSGLARIDPEGEITKQVIALAKNRVKAGVTDAAQLIDDVHEAIKDFADVTKREVAEAILGQGTPKGPGIESEWAKTKKGVAASLKAEDVETTQRELGQRLQRGPVSPEDASAVWKYARENYVDKGNNNFAEIRAKVASDLGVSPETVTRSLANTKAAKQISNEMWAKMSDRRRLRSNAENWIKQADAPLAVKAFENARRLWFIKATVGHGAVAPFTHAPANAFIATRWADFWRNFGRTYQFMVNKGGHERAMSDLETSPNYITAQRAGLANDPKRGYDEYQSPWMGKVLGKLGVSGNRAFDSLKTMRQDMFDSAWNKMTNDLKTPETAKALAQEINASTGSSKALSGQDWPSRFVGKAMFAAPLEASRWDFLVRDNYRAIKAFSNWKGATTGERYMAKRVASRNAQLVATYGALLAANQGLLTASGSDDKINVTDPTKSDFLAFKVGGHVISPAGGLLTAVRFVGNLVNIGMENKKPREKISDASAVTFKYGRSKLSPLFGTGADIWLQSDYSGRPLPFSKEEGTSKFPRYTWPGYVWSTQTPIPLAEAARTYYAEREKGTSKTGALAKSVPIGAVAATGIRVREDFPSGPASDIYGSDRPKARKEIERLGMQVRGVQKQPDESLKEFEARQSGVNPYIRRALEQVVSDPEYQKDSDPNKIERLKQAKEAAQKEGQAAWDDEHEKPEKPEKPEYPRPSGAPQSLLRPWLPPRNPFKRGSESFRT